MPKFDAYMQRGENHPRAKLTDAQVAEIVVRYADGESQTKLAKVYGISQSQVSGLVSGRRRPSRRWE